MSIDDGQDHGLATRRWQTVVLWLMFAVACGFNLFVQPTGESIGDAGWEFLSDAFIAVTVALPSLVATWAMLVPMSLRRRVSLTLLLALITAGALAEGSMLNSGGDPEQSVAAAVAFVVEFTIACAALLLMRKVLRWELRRPDEQPESPRASAQFSILSILLWTLQIAAFVAFLQHLARSGHHAQRTAFTLGSLAAAVWGGLLSSMVGLVTLPVVWLVLSRGLARLWAAAVLVFAIAGIDVLVSRTGASFVEVTSADAGVLIVTALFSAILRACGYRLVRRATPAARTAESELANNVAPRRRSNPQLIAATLPLLAMLAAIIWQGIQATPKKLRDAATAYWLNLGFSATYWETGDRIVELRLLTGANLGENQIAALAELKEIPILSLGGKDVRALLKQLPRDIRIDRLILAQTNASDAELSDVAQFKSLVMLDLRGTPITDAGLAKLSALPNLRDLSLDRTSITDAGLAELVKFDKLSFVDVTGTAVTPEGLAKLKQDRPELGIRYTGGVVKPSSKTPRVASPQQ